MNRYTRQFQLLQENNIDTGEQLTQHQSELEARISALVYQRKGLYKQKRRGEDVETDIQNINLKLRTLRHDLRLCQQIQADIPLIREQAPLSVEKPPEKQHNKINKRKRGHELWM